MTPSTATNNPQMPLQPAEDGTETAQQDTPETGHSQNSMERTTTNQEMEGARSPASSEMGEKRRQRLVPRERESSQPILVQTGSKGARESTTVPPAAVGNGQATLSRPGTVEVTKQTNLPPITGEAQPRTSNGSYASTITDGDPLPFPPGGPGGTSPDESRDFSHSSDTVLPTTPGASSAGGREKIAPNVEGLSQHSGTNTRWTQTLNQTSTLQYRLGAASPRGLTNGNSSPTQSRESSSWTSETDPSQRPRWSGTWSPTVRAGNDNRRHSVCRCCHRGWT